MFTHSFMLTRSHPDGFRVYLSSIDKWLKKNKSELQAFLTEFSDANSNELNKELYAKKLEPFIQYIVSIMYSYARLDREYLFKIKDTRSTFLIKQESILLKELTKNKLLEFAINKQSHNHETAKQASCKYISMINKDRVHVIINKLHELNLTDIHLKSLENVKEFISCIELNKDNFSYTTRESLVDFKREYDNKISAFKEIALLDVEKIFYVDNEDHLKPNNTIINTLMSAGISTCYLFANEETNFIHAFKASEELVKRGIKVVGIITPADLVYKNEKGKLPYGAVYHDFYLPQFTRIINGAAPSRNELNQTHIAVLNLEKQVRADDNAHKKGRVFQELISDIPHHVKLKFIVIDHDQKCLDSVKYTYAKTSDRLKAHIQLDTHHLSTQFIDNDFSPSAGEIMCSLSELNAHYYSQKLTYNQNANLSCMQKLFGEINTPRWQKKASTLRNQAWDLLNDNLKEVCNNQDKLKVIDFALTLPLFTEHRNNHIFTGAFGNTGTVNKLISLRKEIDEIADLSPRCLYF